MAHRLFGTDGVRGKAGEYPLDHETVARLGGALVRAMRHSAAAPQPLRFVVGRDTRESGEWIERELARGVHSAGAEIRLPASFRRRRSRLSPAMGFDAGLVISASHNPFEDNGIKVFSGPGEKFTETLEREVEAIVHDRSWSVGGSADVPVRTTISSMPTSHTRGSRCQSRTPRPVQVGDRRGERCDHDRGTQAVSRAGLRRSGAERAAGWSEHQPRLRVDAPGADFACGA